MQKDATPLTSPTTGLQDHKVAHSWQIQPRIVFFLKKRRCKQEEGFFDVFNLKNNKNYGSIFMQKRDPINLPPQQVAHSWQI